MSLKPKHTFKEFEMVRKKHQEGDNALEATTSSFGLQEGWNQTTDLPEYT